MRYAEKIRSVLSAALLVFALVSIGYMLGKNSARDGDRGRGISAEGNYVAVYYLHSTFRCETCNTIEAMTEDLLEREYATYLTDGRMQWQEIDFMKNTELASRFEVAASCVVVADIRDGEVRDYQRLNKVWTLISDPPAFDSYLRKAIDPYLNGGNGK
jgi:hypothetical protein